ncbi:hypothetical protein HON22_03200, partial [Candidatus Peregrinibacteria bacterium]|nr:hypothetical protein [Candidatus Peregrinibacteria bacterium]
MKKILGFLFLLCMINSSVFALEKKDGISLYRISAPSPYYQAGDTISIYGSNLGKDTSKLQLYIDDKSYSIEKSYGNEVQIKLTKDSKSGLLYIKKATDENGGIKSIETNRLEINLLEPLLSKVQSKNGLFPGAEIVLTGENLDDSEIFCGNETLTPKLQGKSKIILHLENKPLNCAFEIRKHGFILQTQEKIEIKPLVYYFQILLKNNYIYAYGKGFNAYKEDIDDFSLEFQSKSIKNAEYISDSEIRFPHSISIPAKGLSNLSIKSNKLPPVSYSFTKDLPYIVEVSPPELTKDNQIYFSIITSIPLNDIYRNSGFIIMDGQKITGEIKGKKLEIIQKGLPSESGEIWVEMNKLEGKHYPFSLDLDFHPQITKIHALLRNLDKSGGRILVHGNNFYPKDSVKISSSIGELKITQLQSNSFRALLPSPVKEGDYNITISNTYGSSTPVNFSIPATSSKRFYPYPKITKIEYPTGPFPGATIRVHGEGLANITSINYADSGFKTRWSNSNTLEAQIPKKIEKSGEITVTSNFKEKSNSLDYEIFSRTKKKHFTTFFPTKKSIHLIEKENEFQPILHFSIKNTKKPALAHLQWKIFCNTSKDCLTVFPFTEYQLLDSKKEVIDDLLYEIDTQKNTLSLKNVPIPASGKFLHYTIEAKVFPQLLHDEIRSIQLVSVSAFDKENRSIHAEKKTRDAKVYIRRIPEKFKPYC